ncbi:hypothetical protein CVT25_014593 [Psilocybe cyanescens]|uniref:CCHC-type domain-containing protein n=1 Tax=Psilocybe cyanescens TaxID=93625 RepID=A0A409X8U0_PSICY|nr:hypothetical protein CVT25_014593 [Psilocybe cyanescens]
MGHPVNDAEFYAIIMGSLPTSYDSFVSVIDATFRTTVSTHLYLSLATSTSYVAPSPSPENLMTTVIEEYERPTSTSYVAPSPSPENLMTTVIEEYERRSLRSKSGRKDTENVAFYSNDSSKGNRDGVECFNCHKPGHYKSECWNKGGGKEGQRPKRTKGNGKSKGKGKDSKDSKASNKGKEKEKDEKSSDKANTAKDDLPAEAWATMLDDTPDVPLILEYLDDRVIFEFARGTRTERARFESPSPQTELDDDGTSTDSSMPELSDVSDSEDEDTEELPQRDVEFDEHTTSFFDDSDLDSDDEEMPNLQSVSDSESDNDEPDEATFDFSDEESDVGSDTDSNEFILFDYTDENDYEWESHVSDNNAAYKTSYTVEELTTPSADAHIDLYDSGATRHMSGAKDRFKNLIPIEPKSIAAADNRSFSATAKGDMIIYIPNGSSGVSEVLLKDVLYAPTMSVTLVSISRIVESSASVLFFGKSCQIYDKNETCIGNIPVHGGLYRVYTKQPSVEFAGKTKVLVSINELHRRLGHVSHARAKYLIDNDLVLGVELDPTSKPSVCESCEWAKGQ